MRARQVVPGKARCSDRRTWKLKIEGRLQKGSSCRWMFHKTPEAANGPAKCLTMRHGSNGKSRVREALRDRETMRVADCNSYLARPTCVESSAPEENLKIKIDFEIYRILATIPAPSTCQGISPRGSSSGRTLARVSSPARFPNRNDSARHPRMDFGSLTSTGESRGACQQARSLMIALWTQCQKKSGTDISIILMTCEWSSS